MAFLLSSAGLEIQTTDEITDEIKAQLWADISPGLNLSTTTALGQLISIFGDKCREMQELTRAVYSAFDPDASTGASLDRVGALTGTDRNEATKSQLVSVTVNVAAGFSALAGEMVASVTGDPARRFVNKDAVSNPSGIAANVSADFEAENSGPTECLAGQLTTIAGALTGWNSVTNPTDAILGSDEETDAAYRVRRRDELSGGTHYVDAIRTDILQNDALEVTFCKVLENDTDAVDADGHPAHSIEVIAYGPPSPTNADNDALAEQILESKPAGIQAYGTTVRTVVDDQGNSHSIGLTRPTSVLVYLEVDVTTDVNYPTDGDVQVALALATVGDSYYQPGDDVIAERLKAAAFTVAGVIDVTALRIGLAVSPVATANLVIALREIATLDTSRVLVTST